MSMANETMNLSEKDDTNFFIRVVRYFIPWKATEQEKCSER